MLAKILALVLSTMTGISPVAPVTSTAAPAAASAPPAITSAPPASASAPAPAPATPPAPASAPPADPAPQAAAKVVAPAPAAQKKTPAQSFGGQLDAAVAKVPGASSATWIVEDKGAWGATDLAAGVVYVAPRTPANRLLDVVRHEWVHVQQGRVYGGIAKAKSALASVGGIEVVADCGAKLLGAGWTHYVKACTPEQTAAAKHVLAGRAA